MSVTNNRMTGFLAMQRVRYISRYGGAGPGCFLCTGAQSVFQRFRYIRERSCLLYVGQGKGRLGAAHGVYGDEEWGRVRYMSISASKCVRDLLANDNSET